MKALARAVVQYTTEYFVGHEQVQQLRLRAQSDAERAAIERLAEFRGDESDVRTAAALYTRASEPAYAAELLRILESA